MTDTNVRCHNCGETGHYARSCPATLPDTYDRGQLASETYAAHLARIDSYVAEWMAGRLSIDEKRRLISDENKSFYGPNVRRALVWP